MMCPRWIAASAGVLAVLATLVVGLMIPLDIRHSAPYGFSQTVDLDRQIAVNGGYVTVNYPNFNRVDLDLRAYSPGAVYDLTVHIRPAVSGAEDVRTIRLNKMADEIFHQKQTFDNPFTTLRFPPILDSVGQTYYVWVERGPRNRDDVIAVWSIKSYSHVPGRAVLSAFMREPPGGNAAWIVQGAIGLALLVFIAGVGVIVSVLTRLVYRPEGSAREPHLRRWQDEHGGGIH